MDKYPSQAPRFSFIDPETKDSHYFTIELYPNGEWGIYNSWTNRVLTYEDRKTAVSVYTRWVMDLIEETWPSEAPGRTENTETTQHQG